VSGGLSRRRFLGGAAAAAALASAPRRARGIGAGSLLRLGDVTLGGAGGGRAAGLASLGHQLELRTSVVVARDNPAAVQVGDAPRLFENPFLYFSGDKRFALPSPHELEVLRRHLTFGGFMLIDSAEGRAGGEFDGAVRQLVAELFPPPLGLAPLGEDHVIFKSFYLLRSLAGRVAATGNLEAVVLDGRAALVYSQNDLGGAWMRAYGGPGGWAYQCYPGGETQREHAFRLGINIVMYALCLDYKTDQVHVPFILKRRHWQVEP
jgi:uncharacterized protein DUF4159